MTMITPSYLGETIEYSSLHACRSTLEDPTGKSDVRNATPLTSPFTFIRALPQVFLTSNGMRIITHPRLPRRCSRVARKVLGLGGATQFDR